MNARAWKPEEFETWGPEMASKDFRFFFKSGQNSVFTYSWMRFIANDFSSVIGAFGPLPDSFDAIPQPIGWEQVEALPSYDMKVGNHWQDLELVNPKESQGDWIRLSDLRQLFNKEIA